MPPAEAAMDLLCERMSNPDAPVELKALPVELVQRESIKPPR